MTEQEIISLAAERITTLLCLFGFLVCVLIGVLLSKSFNFWKW